MSIPVPLAELADTVARFGSVPYLLTVGPDATPHAASVTVEWSPPEAPLKAPDHPEAALKAPDIPDAIPAIISVSAPVEQSGVLGSLSRTRSPVQVRSGARLALCSGLLWCPAVAPSWVLQQGRRAR